MNLLVDLLWFNLQRLPLSTAGIDVTLDIEECYMVRCWYIIDCPC